MTTDAETASPNHTQNRIAQLETRLRRLEALTTCLRRRLNNAESQLPYPPPNPLGYPTPYPTGPESELARQGRTRDYNTFALEAD